MERTRAKIGFSLIEVCIVVAILALVATIAVRRFADVRDNARRTVAMHDMRTIRDSITGDDGLGGFLADMERVPGFSPAWLRIANLLSATNLYAYAGTRETDAAFLTWDSGANRGWRGPYVRIDRGGVCGPFFPKPGDRRDGNSPTFAECGFFPFLANLSMPADYVRDNAAYGFPGEPALFDPWGSPYILQIPPPQAFAHAGGILADVSGEERFRYARIVSAGPDGRISTPCFAANTNSSGSAWGPAARRNSIFAGDVASRGDDIVLFISRSDIYNPDYCQEGDAR